MKKFFIRFQGSLEHSALLIWHTFFACLLFELLLFEVDCYFDCWVFYLVLIPAVFVMFMNGAWKALRIDNLWGSYEDMLGLLSPVDLLARFWIYLIFCFPFQCGRSLINLFEEGTLGIGHDYGVGVSTVMVEIVQQATFFGGVFSMILFCLRGIFSLKNGEHLGHKGDSFFHLQPEKSRILGFTTLALIVFGFYINLG